MWYTKEYRSKLRSNILKARIKNIKFFTLATACATILAMPAHQAKAESFTPEQKKELEAMFNDYIMSNPKVIMDSVEKYRTDQEKRVQQDAEKNLEDYMPYFQRDDLPIAGNPEGDVTIVEYFDYNCGYCRKAFEDIQKIIDTDKNVRVVFQEMPILSPSSNGMAKLALAAHRQGKYFEFHTALMDYRGSQSEEAFLKVAAEVGLDVDQLKKDSESEAVLNEIRTSLDMARSLGIRGTPGFVIGDKVYPGYIGLDGLKNAVKNARAEKE